MTNVTIIIHEGRGGRGPAGRMGRHHGRPEEQTEARGEHHGRHHHGAGCGHRHEHGERQGGCGHHGRSQEQTEGRGEHRHGHRHHGAGHAPGSPADEQRQLARRLRHQMRHIMQEAEAAGLSPERIERVVRRETRRSYL